MSLIDADHRGTREFLGRLERGDLKALQPPVFSPYNGPGGVIGGLFAGHLWQPSQPGAKHNYEAEAGDLWRNSAVAICLAWYGDNLPEPDFRVVRTKADGTREVLHDHPLIRLLRNPNPHYGWHALVKSLILSYRTDGNAFLLVAKGNFYRPGDPVQLYWIDHRRMTPRWDNSGRQYLGWWDYRIAGMPVEELGLDQVIHLRDGIDPLNDRLGCCALKSCLREVCSDNQAATYTGSILRNMGVSGVVIQPGSDRAEFGSLEEREEIAATFQSRTTGENRGKPLVSNDAWKIDQVGANPEQMALDKIQAIPEGRIVAAMRLNGMVVGLASGEATKTFSNYGESRKAAYEDGVIPFQKELAWVFTRALMPLLGDPATEVLEFDYSKVQCLAESEDARFARYGKAYQTDKVITHNQALAGLNLPTVATGDRYADGSTPEPAEDSPATSMPVDGAVVQDQALNGTQIASLLSITTAIATGQIPLETGRAAIVAAFPSLTPEQVGDIVEPLKNFTPAAAGPPPGPGGKPPIDDPADEDDEAIKAMIPRMNLLLDSLTPREVSR